jgi:lycopene beta-cyclase
LQTQYDYIIAGAGCAGLSLALRMIANPYFDNKSILIIDQDFKTKNDRTFCYWENKKGFFEEVVHHKWPIGIFKAHQFETEQNLHPYEYKMIRGINFYKYCFDKIADAKNIHIHYGTISLLENNYTNAIVKVDAVTYTASKIFCSILLQKPKLQAKDIYLLQHYKGFVIRTPQPAFDVNKAIVMDFSIAQTHGTSFVYVLPTSATSALVEYTLFTHQQLDPNDYIIALKKYIRNDLKIDNYVIAEEENGIIPMTTFDFKNSDGHIVYIGTAGGATKPSSGYTFSFIQKQTTQIITQLTKGEKINSRIHTRKFKFYDHVLLYLLNKNSITGHDAFKRMFQHNSMVQLFRFLDNDTNLAQEAKIFVTLNVAKYFKASLKVLAGK